MARDMARIFALAALAALPALAAPSKKNQAAEEAAVKAAASQVAKLQASRDSLSRLRWNLRQTGLDTRERWQTEQDRVREELEKASAERARLLEEIREARERGAQVKPGPDPVIRQREGWRQEMLDRAELLRDKVRFGIPWEEEERAAAILQAMRGIESYASAQEGLQALADAHFREWDFSRQVEKEEGEFPRASGGPGMGARVRVAALGAWYLTRDNAAGLLARSGSGDKPYAWHENLLPETQRAVLTGIGSRALELPADPMQVAVGEKYFLPEDRGLWKTLFDMQEGPLSRIPILLARVILGLLIGLGVAILVVFLRRRTLVRREAADADAMRVKLFKALTHRQSAESVVDKADVHTVAGRIVHLGFDNRALAPEALEQLMVSQESVEARRLGRGLNFLGTVASNAAFIGLLGTVLGILDAFAHLGTGGADASLHVMTAIAEALIATALGLGVAIPAVVFYNHLSHNVNEVMEEARELRHLILAAGLETVAGASPVKEEAAYGG